MRQRTRGGAAAVALFCLVSSCTSHQTNAPASPHGADSSTSRSEVGPLPSPTASAAGKEPVEVLWKWHRVGPSTPARYNGNWDADRDYVVTSANGRDVWPSVVDRNTGKPVARITPSPGYVLGPVHLDKPWVVWDEVEDIGADVQDARGHVLNLRTGHSYLVDGRNGLPDPGLPSSWSVRDGRAAFTIQAPHRNCVVVLSLGTRAARTARCTDRRAVGTGFAELTKYGLAVNEFDPHPKPHGCVRVLAARFKGQMALSRFRPLPARSRCNGFLGHVGPDFVAWEEQRPAYPDVADLYARADGRIVRLGDILADRVTGCGRWLYYMHSVVEIPELLRWRPGSPVEVIYAARDPWVLTSDPVCQDDHIVFARGFLGAGPLRYQVLEGRIPPQDR